VSLKQPAIGVLSTFLVCAVSLAFISAFEFPVFAGWVSYYLMCVVTVQIMMVTLWRGQHPRFAVSRPQPVKGALMTLTALAGGAAVCALSFVTVGQTLTPLAPMVIEFTIASVVITFWVCIVWGGWPSSLLVKNPVAAGVVQLVGGYLVNFLLFRALFNYGFMRGAPVYVDALDPRGMISAAQVLPWYVTVLAAMFVVIAFDLWPLTKSPRVMKQPLLGLVWTAVIMAVGSVVFYLGTVIGGLDPMIFLVSVSVPYLFGSIVILNMCENSLFARYSQPTKGILNVLAAIGIGGGLSGIYWMLMPTVSGAIPSGPPSYAAQVWLASSLLAVTFPFLVVYSAFFDLWPLRTTEAPVREVRAELS
jgi:hypothetical protein